MVTTMTEKRRRLYEEVALAVAVAPTHQRPRFYNPAVARFTEMDSFMGDVKSPLTLHKYLYCNNDPVDHIDPSGRDLIGAFGFMGSMLSMEMTIGMMLEQAAFTVAKGAAITAALQGGKPAAQLRQDGIDLMALYGNKYYETAFKLYTAGSMGVAQACENAVMAYYAVELAECAWNVLSLGRSLVNLARSASTSRVIVSTTSSVYALIYARRGANTVFVSVAHTMTVESVQGVKTSLEAIHAAGESLLTSVEIFLGPKPWNTVEEMEKETQIRDAIKDFCAEHEDWKLSESESSEAMLVLNRI